MYFVPDKRNKYFTVEFGCVIRDNMCVHRVAGCRWSTGKHDRRIPHYNALLRLGAPWQCDNIRTCVVQLIVSSATLELEN